MELIEFIQEGYLILIVVLWIIGQFFKNTTIIKDKHIPIALLFLGIVGAFGIGGINVDTVFQGIISTGIAVLGNQTVKQLSKDE